MIVGRILCAMLLAALSATAARAVESPPAAPATPDPALAELDGIRSLHRRGQLTEAQERARALWAQAQPGADAAFSLDVLQEVVDLAVKTGSDDAVELARRLVRDTGNTGDRTRTATAVSRLAQAYHRGGDYDAARREAERAVAMHEAAGSPEAAQALSLKILANLYVDRDLLDEAKVLFERVLPVDAAGDPVEYAKTLYNYGRLLGEAAEFDHLREVYLQALDTLQAAAPRHPLMAWLHNGLAGMYLQVDDYAAAREEYEATLGLLGQRDPLTLSCRNNLAVVLSELGLHERAEEILRSVCAAQVEAEGDDGLTVAGTRMNLADVLLRAGRTTEARELLERSLAVRTERLGAGHLQTTASLERLGLVDLERGQVDLAVGELQQLVQTRRALRGTQPVFLGGALVDLARAQVAAKRFDAALGAATEARALLEETVGPTNPRVAYACEAAARAEAGAGNVDAALEAALQAESVARAHAALTIDLLPEREAVRFADVRGGGLDLAHRLLLDAAPKPEAEARVFDALVRSRALVLDTLRRRRAADTDPVLLKEMRVASRELANLLVEGPGEDPAAFHHRMDAATERRERAERELARRAVASGTIPTASNAGADAVVRALPAHTALVAFLRLRLDAPGVARAASPARYVAWVVRRDAKAPLLVDLEDADVVDDAIVQWRREIAKGASPTPATPDALATCRAAGTALRRVIWDPIAPLVSGADTVLLVPDGSLHLINFATLPDATTSWLVESGPCFHVLSAERDLLRPWPQRRSAGALFVGDVAYGDVARPEGRLPRFEPLPGTGEEIRALRTAWPARAHGAPEVLSGAAATEAAVAAAAHGVDVIHFATHGFFLDEGVAPSPAGTRGIGAVVRTPAAGRRWPVSGLALAGANDRTGPDDGVLTAEEIAALDLAGTRWAVLSACDTGLGEIRRGEGVLGLRRAFELAGVRTLILSLWDVDDESTRDWMTRLYAAHWTHGLDTAQAVRQAEREMLMQERSKRRSEHPYAWGAFVAVGDWQ